MADARRSEWPQHPGVERCLPININYLLIKGLSLIFMSFLYNLYNFAVSEKTHYERRLSWRHSPVNCLFVIKTLWRDVKLIIGCFIIKQASILSRLSDILTPIPNKNVPHNPIKISAILRNILTIQYTIMSEDLYIIIFYRLYRL